MQTHARTPLRRAYRGSGSSSSNNIGMVAAADLWLAVSVGGITMGSLTLLVVVAVLRAVQGRQETNLGHTRRIRVHSFAYDHTYMGAGANRTRTNLVCFVHHHHRALLLCWAAPMPESRKRIIVLSVSAAVVVLDRCLCRATQLGQWKSPQVSRTPANEAVAKKGGAFCPAISGGGGGKHDDDEAAADDYERNSSFSEHSRNRELESFGEPKIATS